MKGLLRNKAGGIYIHDAFWKNNRVNFLWSVNMSRRILIFSAFMAISLLLSGCSNTFNGAGRDIEGWGRSIQNTF